MGSELASMARVLQGAITRGVVKGVKADGKLQSVQVETTDGFVQTAEHFEPFGLTGNPGGGEAIVLQVGGTGHPVVPVVSDRTKRPKGLGSGDVTLYDGHGHRIDLTDTGVAVNADTTVDGYVDATSFKCNGSAGANGILTFVAQDGPVVLVITRGIITSVTATGWAEIP